MCFYGEYEEDASLSNSKKTFAVTGTKDFPVRSSAGKVFLCFVLSIEESIPNRRREYIRSVLRHGFIIRPESFSCNRKNISKM